VGRNAVYGAPLYIAFIYGFSDHREEARTEEELSLRSLV
jgi:hypothetical protein